MHRWQGVSIAILVFAALWETRDHTVPASADEWKAWLANAVTPSEQVIQYGMNLRESFHVVVQSSKPFLIALCKLVYLISRPLVLGAHALLSKASYGFYEFVIIRLICSPTTIRNVKYFVQQAIQWQMNRTKREIALEVAILSSVIGMYFFIRFLNRRRYLERLKLWIRRKRRLMHLRYKAFLQNLAAVNRTLAIMAPHSLFLSGVFCFECFFFSIGRWLIEQTPVIAMLSTGKPIMLTILLAYDLWNDRQLREKNKSKRGKKASGRSRRSLAAEIQPLHLNVHQNEILRYWVVRATLAAVKKAYLLLPFASTFIRSHSLLISLLCKLEFWFWVWVNAMPYLAPTSIGGEDLPDPIRWLVEHIIKPVALNLQQGVALDFPQIKSFWDNTVMVAAPSFLRSLTWISILSKDTAELLIHFTSQGRTFVAPLLLVMIYPLRGFGILCVSHLLPIVGSLKAQLVATEDSPRTEEHWLQTWVLHVILSFLLNFFAPFVWWVPGVYICTFFLYVWLSLCPPATIDRYYRTYIQEELQVWNVLPPGDIQKESYIGNFVLWVIEKIPKAEGVEPVNGSSASLVIAESELHDSGVLRESLDDANVISGTSTNPIETPLAKENDYPAQSPVDNDKQNRTLRKRRVSKPRN